MEVNDEQNSINHECCICGSPDSLSSHQTDDKFINKSKNFVPLGELISKTLDFEIPSGSLIEMCECCTDKIIDFYHFKRMSEEKRTNFRKENSHHKVEEPDESLDRIVYTTFQIVRNYITRYAISEIKEDENEQRLVITPKPNSPSSAFQDLVKIKSEPMEIKLEPISVDIKDDPDNTFLHFIRGSFGDSGSSEELTNSSEGSLSRLPAFEETTYFDGDKFVLRSEMPPKKMKEAKKRQRKPEMWATNIQKKLRNAGKRYRSSKGYIVEARNMAPPCTCRQECATKVNEKNRLMNFSTYWSLDDISKKRKFIVDHIKLEKPMRALKKSRALSRLILHYLDVANSDGSSEKIKVCKTMFLNTLDISNTVITTTVKVSNQYFEENEQKCRI